MKIPARSIILRFLIPGLLLLTGLVGWGIWSGFKAGTPDDFQYLQQASLLRQLRPPAAMLDPADSPIVSLYLKRRFGDVAAVKTDKAASGLDEILIGNSLALTGRWREAQAHFEKVPQGPHRADARANLALVFSALGDPDRGIEAAVEALEADQKYGNLPAQAGDLGTLGTFAFRLGDFAKAMGAHEAALKLAKEAKDPWLEATERTSIGNFLYIQRHFDSALDYQKEALPLYRSAGDPIGEAHALTSLGLIQKEKGNREEALRSFDEAKEVYRRIGDREEESRSWINLALLHQDREEYDAALDAARTALSLERQGSRSLGTAVALGTIGSIQKSAGDFPGAIKTFEEALALFEKAGAEQQIHGIEIEIKSLKDQVAASTTPSP
jgi:tetratricopeptide (TPR) repeat protein